MQASNSIMSAAEKVARARQHLIVRKPFFGALLMRLKIRPTRKYPSMVTDAVWVAYNPDFVDQCSVEEVEAVLAHEALHCALKHPFRCGGREPEAFEEACDHVVNLLMVKDGGFAAIEALAEYCDPQFEGMSMEQVYPIVLARRESEQQAQQEQQQGQQGDESDQSQGSQQSSEEGEEGGEGSSQDGQPEGGDRDARSPGEIAAPGALGSSDDADTPEDPESAGAGDLDGESDDSDEGDDPGEGEGGEEGQEEQQGDPESESEPEPAEMSEADERALEESWGEAAASAAQQALARGHGSKGMQRAVLKSERPPLSFADYVRNFMMRCQARTDQTWSRPSRRSQSIGVYLPTQRSEQIDTLVVAIDTSGSIGEKQLALFCANVQQAREDLRPKSTIVIFADDGVRGEVELSEHEVFEVSMKDCKGFGGTDFCPTFERVVQLRDEESRQIDGVLYLTDLDGGSPSAEWAAVNDVPPTLWCFDAHEYGGVARNNALVAAIKFGEVVNLNQ